MVTLTFITTFAYWESFPNLSPKIIDNSFYYWGDACNWVFFQFKTVNHVWSHSELESLYITEYSSWTYPLYMIGKIVQDLHNQSILFLCVTQMLQWEARLGFYNWLIIPSSHVVDILLTWLFRYLDKRSRLVISCFKLSCIWTSRHFVWCIW